MLAVLFGIKCKKKVLAKQNNAKKSASTIGKSLPKNRILVSLKYVCEVLKIGKLVICAIDHWKTL